MEHATERLSLAEVEALACDSLIRAGAEKDAAAATGWAVRVSERNGDPVAGLARLPALIEGLRMASILPVSQFAMERAATTRLTVDARSGLSDAAIGVAFETLLELVRSYGTALLTVTATGDRPMPRPWVERLAASRILGLSIGGVPGSGVAIPPDAGSEPEFRAEVSEGDMQLLATLTGEVPSPSIAEDMVQMTPVRGSVCFIGIAEAQPPDDTGSDPLGAGGVTGKLAERRQKADAVGVDVDAELLVRILTF